MHKRILALIAGLAASATAAAVDVNQATVADLDGLRGIGPALSGRILQEREKGEFRNWDDLVRRVPGLGRASAARLSEAGLSVGGAAYGPPAASAPPAPSGR